MRISTLVLLWNFFLAASGCGTAMSNLKTRASYDFNCPESQLLVTKLGGGSYGVDGCGRRGTYVKVGVSPYTKWVLNNELTSAQ